MRPRLFALAGVAAAFLMASATAGADSGTLSGSIPPTDCGPLHPITVVAGETTITAMATATVAANDITLELYDPGGTLKSHADTLTSPEEIVYQSADLTPGAWNVQVCPFAGGVLAAPYTYAGTYATSDVPVVDGVPGSGGGAAGGTPTPRYVAGRLVFSPPTTIDPQRTEGEPLNFLDPGTDVYWESGPWGTTTQQSFIHRSTDNGLEFHVDSPIGLRPDLPPGGGDTDITVDDQGYHYFVDLEGLVNLGTAVSNDDGDNWRKNPVAVQNAAVDRQWYAIDNGPTSAAFDNTVFLAFHEAAVGTYIYSSPGSTGPNDPIGGLIWQNASANAPRPLAADATCAQLRFDKITRNLYYACNEGTHVRLTIGHVEPGQRTGIVFHNITLPESPGGGGPGHLFPAFATDSGGNVYAAWIDTNDNGVYYSSSTDQGESWTTPVRVSVAPATTAEFLWAQGGTAGTLALAWYATDAQGQPDSTGESGEEAYRIFYVGAESTGGQAPQYFAGSTTCTETTPGNCKVVNYPATMTAQGRVCGNIISVDVPVNGGFGVGLPVGSTLYGVTAFTFGRNDPNDIYADVDATHAFDFSLGGPTGGSAC